MTSFASKCFIATSVLCLASSTLFADVRLPQVLSDHMVLQREMPVRIWGWAEPGEQVTVTINKASKTTKTDANSNWEVQLPAMKAGGAYTLTIEGKNKLEITDVLIGELWFCSGQSNMALPVLKSLNHDKEIQSADHPNIRFLTTPERESQEPATDAKVKWVTCTPKTIAYFSATAYYFAREIQQKLNVPVGLIVSAVNGTRIEPWTPANGVESVKELVGKDKVVNGVLYNGMIHPFTKYTIRGVLWYQGEGNVGDGFLYYHRMRALINGWRKTWGQDDFPFYYVQLTPLNWGGKPKDQHAEVWEAQAEALKISTTGMAVTNDIGNIGDAHPRNKQEVGRRLSLWALANTYAVKDIVYSGAVYKAIKIDGDKIRIVFDHVHGGLLSRNGKPLDWFTIAGEDGQHVPAIADIDGDTVVVSSPDVKKPTSVRFAWHQNAQPNLMNKAGLPTSAFRTDRK